MNSQSAMQNNGAKVAVIVDSRYGSTLALARAIKEGVAGTTAEVRLRRVPLAPPEYSIDEDRKSYRETRKDLTGLNEATVDDMRWATGIIFGSPTRYGLMSTPMRAFIDSIACLWREGALIGKVGAAFTSSGGMHSGNEMTLLTTLLPLLQHGMVIVGVPTAYRPWCVPAAADRPTAPQRSPGSTATAPWTRTPSTSPTPWEPGWGAWQPRSYRNRHRSFLQSRSSAEI